MYSCEALTGLDKPEQAIDQLKTEFEDYKVDGISTATHQEVKQVAMKEMLAINKALSLACADNLDGALTTITDHLTKNG